MFSTFDPGTNAVITSATVNIYNPGTVTPISATIFDRLGNTLSNPLTSDATTGLVDFYLTVAQEVDVVVSKSGFTTRTYSNVPVLDDSSLELTALLTTTGDMVYASGNNAPARLPIGGSNTLLHGGATPTYSNIATADIAANAVSQIVTNFQNPPSAATTTSSSLATISGLDTSITATGGPIVLWVSVGFSNNSSAAQNNAFGALVDSGADLANFIFGTPASNANEPQVATYIVYLGALSAGSHTVHLRWSTTGGTLSLVTSGSTHALLVELKK